MKALLVNTRLNLEFDPTVANTLDRIDRELTQSAWQVCQIIADTGEDLKGALREFAPDVVFCYDYRAGDGVDLRQICRVFGIPEVFSSPESLAHMLDKNTTKRLAQEAMVTTLPGVVVHPAGPLPVIDFSGPFFLKPLYGGDSRGIGPDNVVVDPMVALQRAGRLARECQSPYLLEQFLQGTDLVEVAYFRIPGRTRDWESLIRYDYSTPGNQKYRYLSKAIKDNGSLWNLRLTPFTGCQQEEVLQNARRLVDALQAQGVVRAEFLVSDGSVRLIEINGIPGINSCYDLTARQHGLSRKELTEEMFLGALARSKRSQTAKGNMHD